MLDRKMPLPLSDLIQDEELRKIAKTHGLDSWNWGMEDSIADVLRMEGAAIAIGQMYEDRDVMVFVHRSGAMAVYPGLFLPFDVNPHQEVRVDSTMDWDDDPVVKQYECKNALTLCWDEGQELFGED